MKTCSVKNCSNKVHAKKCCGKHYRRIQRFGMLETKKGPTSNTDLTLKERFEASFEPITESGCWIWTMSINPCGYGRLCYKNERKMAHVYSFELHRHKVENGLCVLHRCDIPSCVNPEHLFTGTRADNNLDKMNKGRHVVSRGHLNGNAKLSEKDRLDIKSALASGRRIFELAREYNVQRDTIARVKKS